MDKPENPPAFPHRLGEGFGNENYDTPGMTLRDYFAAKMLNAMVASPELLQVVTANEFLNGTYAERVAFRAYQYADAMLVERGKK